MYGLPSKYFGILIRLLSIHSDSIDSAWIFGSRARGDYQRASDIDLAIEFRKPSLALFSDEVERSRLPYKVDIIDMKNVKNARLAENIRRDGKLIFSVENGVMKMTQEQMKMKLAEYERAVMRLSAALSKNISDDDVYLDGIIQRFEFSFELAWKLMKAYLAYEGTEVQSPRGAIREGFAASLLPDAEDWLDMLEARNLSSHTYDEETAIEIHRLLKEKYFSLLMELKDEVSRRLILG